jgi:hypothetical protein
MRKKRMALLAVFLLLTLFARPAWAQDITTIQVGSTDAYENGTITAAYINTRQADITVTTGTGVDSVEVGGQPTVASATYTFSYEDYEFSKGGNSILVEAFDSLGALLDDVTIAVYYYERDEFYRSTSAFTGSGQVAAFSNAIKLSLGKDNYLKNSSNEATADTSINIAIESRINPNFRTNTDLDFYSCVSPVFRISTGDAASVKLSKPCTLTLKIDAGVPASQYPKLSIVRSDDDFATVEFMGGVASTSAKTITTDGFIDLPNYSYAVMLYNKAVQADWAEFSVVPLMAKGMISKSVTLTSNTTRRDLAKMFVKGMGVTLLPLPLPATPVFSDIPLADPDRIYIETAAAYGIMRGMGDGTFSPNTCVTREQAAAVLCNVTGLKLVDDETKLTAALAKLYVDYDTISDWAGPAVLAATKAKFMVGIPVDANDSSQGNNFSPSLNLDYLQSATIVYNVMKKNKRI